MTDAQPSSTNNNGIWEKIYSAANKNLIATVSLVVNILILIILIAILNWAWQNGNIWWIAVSAGGLGGLIHEFAQSGGTITYMKSKEDGLYLGSIAGIILGVVAGILVINPIAGQTIAAANMTTTITNMTTTITNMTTTTSNLPTTTTNLAQVAFGAFTAGLALKGVTEATTGKAVD